MARRVSEAVDKLAEMRMTDRAKRDGSRVLKVPRCYKLWATAQIRVPDQCQKQLIVKDVEAAAMVVGIFDGGVQIYIATKTIVGSRQRLNTRSKHSESP